ISKSISHLSDEIASGNRSGIEEAKTALVHHYQSVRHLIQARPPKEPPAKANLPADTEAAVVYVTNFGGVAQSYTTQCHRLGRLIQTILWNINTIAPYMDNRHPVDHLIMPLL